MTPPNPTDLGRLRNRGAKMIVYHGVSDPVFMVGDTTGWYDQLRNRHGGDASDFARVFRVPGMSHCSIGPATDQFDALSALVAWVEQGQAPDTIIATARGPGHTGGANSEVPFNWAPSRTRPLCPYPKVAATTAPGASRSDQFQLPLSAPALAEHITQQGPAMINFLLFARVAACVLGILFAGARGRRLS